MPKLLFVLGLAGVGELWSQSGTTPPTAQVTLSPTTSPAAGQPGTILVNVTGSNFPTGTISPSDVVVTLAPAVAGAGPTLSAVPSAVTTIVGSTRRVTFQIPASQSLAPNVAPAGTKLTVKITLPNANILPGDTTANFGAGISVGGAPAGSPGLLKFIDGATFTAELTIDPGAVAGARSVQVSSQSTPLPDSFVVTSSSTAPISAPGISLTTPMFYLASIAGKTSTGLTFASGNAAKLTINPDASIVSMVPSSGTAGQSLTATITGQYTNFVQGSTKATFGAGISVGGAAAGAAGPVTVTSPTSAIAQLMIDPAAALGPRTVKVSTGVQQAALFGGFSVTPSQPPSITLNPNSAQQGQGNVPVAITGQNTHFDPATTKVSSGAGITVTILRVSDATHLAIVLTFAVTTLGPQEVTVTTGTEVVKAVFTVTPPGQPPVLSSVVPNTGQLGQRNLLVTITGQFTNFAQPASQVSFGPGIAVNSVNVASATSLTADISIDVGASLGGRTVTVTTGNELASLTNGFTVQQGPPVVTLTAPANLSYLNLSPTTVNGTVSDSSATVTINSIKAPVANGAFSIQLPLAEGPNLITATATSTSGLAGTATIQVTLDTTPPHVTITSPPDQFVTTDSSTSISGIVNDIVVGTVNAQQAQVKVNGVVAQVANRTFQATNILLHMGSNVIQAVAVDQAGNSNNTQITVTRQPPTAQAKIQLISGNNQTGVIGSVLTGPLIVALTDSAGNPVPNTPVIFKVTQNNGMVANGGTPASSLVANTNSQGRAQTQWTLGMRAGAGSDTLEAYAVGFNGTAIFNASSTLGPAGKIVIDSGNNQTAATNQPLPKPLIAVVVDSGNNRLPNVPVTFTVVQGGGSFAGQASFTVNTDSDGRVAATPTIGNQEGNSNNLISATFPGNQGFQASFTASGRAEGPAANTIISGLVLDNSNQPIPGVTIRSVVTNVLNSNLAAVQAAAAVQTDAKGQFALYKAPVGFLKLLVDGSTATTPGTFPTLEYDMVTVAGQVNTVGQPVYLLPIKTNNQLCVTAQTGGGTLTIPEAPGFSLTFAPGQVTFPGGSHTGCVSVTVVHPDKVPMVPGFGQQPRFIVTIQPSGALFNPPAPITLPNVDGLKPREVTEMYSFDHDIGSFVAIGTGTVSDDGQVIRSNPGVGVLKAGWHCGGDPSANGTVADCGYCNFCLNNRCVVDDSQLPPQPFAGCCSGNAYDGQLQCCVQQSNPGAPQVVVQKYPVSSYQTLLTCRARTQNTALAHIFDGCSVPIWLSAGGGAILSGLGAIADYTGDPNEPIAGVKFSDVPNVNPNNLSKACDVHDKCYQTTSLNPIADRKACDDALYATANKACENALPDGSVKLGECFAIVNIFYHWCPAKISPWSITNAESIGSGELRISRFEYFPAELDAN